MYFCTLEKIVFLKKTYLLIIFHYVFGTFNLASFEANTVKAAKKMKHLNLRGTKNLTFLLSFIKKCMIGVF